MENTIIELPTEYWGIIRQVLETSLTAKGSDGARMLHEIFVAFDQPNIDILETESIDQ